MQLTPQEPVCPKDKKDDSFCRYRQRAHHAATKCFKDWEKDDSFCRYHQRVHHATTMCFKGWEIIQDFFDKGSLKYHSKSE